MRLDPFLGLSLILQVLNEKKGINIMALDVRGLSTMTEFFVIAEGNVDVHVKALARSIAEVLKKNGEAPLHIEGESNGDWVVIDYGEIVIHLFVPAMRDKYRLEQLWQKGKIVAMKEIEQSVDKG